VLDLYRTVRRPSSNVADGILMRVETASMTNWLKRELVVTDTGFEWDEWSFRRIVKMTLPFDRIAYVEVLWGPFLDDLNVVGRTPADNLLVRGLDKDTAQRVKAAVSRRLAFVPAA
jgi:hypothetical protein